MPLEGGGGLEVGVGVEGVAVEGVGVRAGDGDKCSVLMHHIVAS